MSSYLLYDTYHLSTSTMANIRLLYRLIVTNPIPSQTKIIPGGSISKQTDIRSNDIQKKSQQQPQQQQPQQQQPQQQQLQQQQKQQQQPTKFSPDNQIADYKLDQSRKFHVSSGKAPAVNSLSNAPIRKNNEKTESIDSVSDQDDNQGWLKNKHPRHSSLSTANAGQGRGRGGVGGRGSGGRGGGNVTAETKKEKQAQLNLQCKSTNDQRENCSSKSNQYSKNSISEIVPANVNNDLGRLRQRGKVSGKKSVIIEIMDSSDSEDEREEESKVKQSKEILILDKIIASAVMFQSELKPGQCIVI